MKIQFNAYTKLTETLLNDSFLTEALPTYKLLIETVLSQCC